MRWWKVMKGTPESDSSGATPDARNMRLARPSWRFGSALLFLLMPLNCVATMANGSRTVVFRLVFEQQDQRDSPPDVVVFQERRVLSRNVERIKSSIQKAASLCKNHGTSLKCTVEPATRTAAGVPLLVWTVHVREEEERITIFCPGYAAITVYLNAPSTAGTGQFPPSVVTRLGGISPCTHEDAERLPESRLANSQCEWVLHLKTLDDFYARLNIPSNFADQVFALADAIRHKRLAKSDINSRRLVWNAVSLQYVRERTLALTAYDEGVRGFERYVGPAMQTIEAWARDPSVLTTQEAK